ncbi:MAG: pdxA [Devosia sp.]|nr:pdxA [Devosia sp.]
MPDFSPPPLAISIGEPAGVGPDIILKLYAERQEHDLPPFVVFGHTEFLRARAARLGYDFPITTAPAEFASTLPVVDIVGLVPDHPGAPSPLSAPVVIEAIRQAVEATMTGTCRGLVTGPIQKSALYAAGFRHPGHTEFIAELCGTGRLPVMMLCHDALRTVPVTIHVPLSAVPGLLTHGLIIETCRAVAHDLRTRFRIAEPKLAVAGLNPHAGEQGSIGLEELDIIGPAIAALQFEGIDITGPLPADTLFYPPHWRRYDAVIAMYHDQALIPIKTVAFEDAVNVTLGLPIVRTSPDHGTALDIAGTGTASVRSLLAAIRLADRLTAAR